MEGHTRGVTTAATLAEQLAPLREDPARSAILLDVDGVQLSRLRVRLEDKASIVAFHWRGAPDESAAEDCVRDIASRAEAVGLTTHWGRKVLEVRPPVRMDKGLGVRRLLRESDVSSAMYAGDDATDLDAFAALSEMAENGRLDHAICVGVRSEEAPEEIVERADVVLDGPGEVRLLLE